MCTPGFAGGVNDLEDETAPLTGHEGPVAAPRAAAWRASALLALLLAAAAASPPEAFGPFAAFTAVGVVAPTVFGLSFELFGSAATWDKYQLYARHKDEYGEPQRWDSAVSAHARQQTRVVR